MAVLNTTSPVVWPRDPMEQPRKTLPSARTRTAGVFCDTRITPGTGKTTGAKKRESATAFDSLIPLSLVENYSRKRCSLSLGRGSGRGSAQPEHVLHVEKPRLLPRHELGRAHRALRVVGAAGGAVGDLDALAGAGEKDGVVAHDIAAARDRESDG